MRRALGVLMCAASLPLLGDTIVSVGPMSTRRAGPTLLRQSDGNVIVWGGEDFGNNVERFNVSTQQFGTIPGSSGGPPGTSSPAVQLPNGLLYGAAETGGLHVFNPATGAWTMFSSIPFGNQSELPAFYSLTAITNTSVLGVAEGTGACIYNPSTSINPVQCFPNDPGILHSATRLLDGRVLIAGGQGPDGFGTSEAFIYNPTTNSVSFTGPMTTARSSHSASLLTDGRVLIAGGEGLNGVSKSVEIYNPATGTFTNGGTLAVARAQHAAVRLVDGRVVLAGGRSVGDSQAATPSIEIYNAATGLSTLSNVSLSLARAWVGGVLLADGRVLFAGGTQFLYTGTSYSTAEVFTASSQSSCPTAAPSGLIGASWSGASSGCLSNNSTPCGVGERIDFQARVFFYTPQACDSYDWDFGDGTDGIGPAPQKSYSRAGSFSVRVSIRNTLGSRTSDPVTVQVGSLAPQLLVNPPPALVDLAGDGIGTIAEWSIANLGSSAVSVTLSQDGSFFSQSPTSFSIAAEGFQRIAISAPDRSVGVILEGTSTITAPGLASPLVIPVKLVSLGPPTGGTALGEAEENRVDLSAPATQNLVFGSTAFRNSGSATLTGVLVSDAPWLTPQAGIITIPPGGRQVISFTIDRSKQPNAATIGSAGASISLVYPTGSASKSRSPMAGTTGTTLVQIIDTKKPATSAGAVIPKLAAGEFGYVVSGVGNVRGGFGSYFLSDLNILNLGSALSDLQIFYVPAGAGNVIRGDASVGGKSGVAFADVVSSVFGGMDQIGTLHLRSPNTAHLAVAANVFNKANRTGTFGTSLPVFRSSRGAPAGESLDIAGLLQEPNRFRTNLYVQEAGGSATTVQVRYFDENGTLLGSTPITLPAYGLVSIPSVQIPQGTVRAQLRNQTNGAVTGFATPTDNSSNDTWAVTDWSRFFGVTAAGTTFIVPGMGSIIGGNGTFFRSDLTLGNPTTTNVAGRLEYYAPGRARVDRTISLPSGRTVRMTDVVGTTFASEGTLGYVRVTGNGLLVSARTYATVGTNPATFGTGIPAVPASSALASGSRRIAGLEDSKSAIVGGKTPATFRANLGLVETTGAPVTVRIGVFFETGTSLAVSSDSGPPKRTIDVALEARGARQLNGILREVFGPEWEKAYPTLRNLQVEITVIGGSGAVLPYVTMTDNGSGDTVLRID